MREAGSAIALHPGEFCTTELEQAADLMRQLLTTSVLSLDVTANPDNR
jgi:hypothetical protein